MKDRVYISDVASHDGKEVSIYGWLYNKRSSGKLWFLLIRDGTGIIQSVAFKGDVREDVFQRCEDVTQESSVKVTGTIRADKRAPGGYELQISDVQILQLTEDYPITPKEHGTTFLMDHRHIWLRSSRQHAVLRIRHEIIRACRDFFDNRGFVLIDAPIFTPAACEGTTTLFETEYFGTQAYLTQSGQLYMEAGAMAFGKVYCFGPTFRAEKSKTRRHLTEFWMIEPEVAYLDLDGDMDLAEDFVEYVVQRILETRREELKAIERDTAALEKVKRPFPRITYDEAAEILKKKEVDFEYGSDFGGADETIISEGFDKPVMVHRYPTEVKAFYMKNDPDDPRKALCVDMLAPEGYGEIIGGGQREDDLKILERKIKDHDLPKEAFEWYLDLRRYGTVPHAGFGLGIERTVAWICGLKHVRETIPFPRLMHRIYP
ncbi:asparagine--tRNA ligase [candidate division KSB1 bacterium]|nr:asparagine--tRNA ligase [candidate division KSB1 bacterium]NIR68702.1 asparagine--tRNA ligase [candidate division KSB1 bacterium]NIS25519.1 asparagine--tRNA ligase [candidate division KSB1 bacterium]NIT72412.1 asparagine--tRNA ligase [candidate division KSB1 bacterium]NIU26196.1 asparagine--tRNA ligase [candidate division KSB1 bacterium]